MTDQNTSPLDLDGLPNDLDDKAEELDALDARGQVWGLEDVADIMRRAATTIRDQAKEAERMRGAVVAAEAGLYNAWLGIDEGPAADMVYDVLHDLRYALAPATGGGDA